MIQHGQVGVGGLENNAWHNKGVKEDIERREKGPQSLQVLWVKLRSALKGSRQTGGLGPKDIYSKPKPGIIE